MGEGGHAGGKRLEELKKAKAKQAEHLEQTQQKLNSATALLDQATQSSEFNTRNLIFDKSLLHKEAANELGLIHTTHMDSPIFNPAHFNTTPDFGRARLIKGIEVADNLSPRYAAVVDNLEGYLEAQQKLLNG